MTQNSSFNPAEHLVEIKDKQGNVKAYLPANWRLYGLRSLVPHITIESEIVHMDVEHNLVVVKAWIFDGKTYSESERRASAYKQGLLSALDKVETGAKARASRDFGIGTEFALDIEAEDDQAGNGKPTVTLASIKEQVKALSLARNPTQWQAWKKSHLGKDIPDSRLSASHLSTLNAAIDQARQQAA